MTRVSHCRVCGSSSLAAYLDLGDQPLANGFLKSASEFQDEPRFPLETLHCEECGLSQLSVIVDPPAMFSEYLFVTGTATASRAHAKALAASWQREFGLVRHGLFLEAASNDGCVLAEFKALGAAVLGVDPAQNLATVALDHGVETIVDYFGERVATEISSQRGQAAGIIARNVLAHVPDVNDFVAGLQIALAADGVLLIEVPSLGILFQNNEYDTIYHEHLSYFSFSTLCRLLAAHDLSVFDVNMIELNGGSMQVFVQHQGAGRAVRPCVGELLAAESASHLTDVRPAQEFAARVESERGRLQALLRELKSVGHRIAGYGAAAKGNTLLNYCGINTQLLDGIADLNPLKQGRFSPGMHIPVIPPRALRDERPDYVLILAWNYGKEIMEQLADLADRGTHFILPMPTVHMV